MGYNDDYGDYHTITPVRNPFVLDSPYNIEKYIDYDGYKGIILLKDVKYKCKYVMGPEQLVRTLFEIVNYEYNGCIENFKFVIKKMFKDYVSTAMIANGVGENFTIRYVLQPITGGHVIRKFWRKGNSWEIIWEVTKDNWFDLIDNRDFEQDELVEPDEFYLSKKEIWKV